MADTHNIPFFGQKTGIILSTTSKEDKFLYLRCIKKKKNGDWEKFNESKNVKISLTELVAISDVLNKNKLMWSTFHSFNNVKTPISFAWDEYDKELLWINIDDYARPLNYPENELMNKIVNHILEEKISYSTQGNLQRDLEKEEINIPNNNDTYENNANYSYKDKNLSKNSMNNDFKKPKNDFRQKTSNSNESTSLRGKIKIAKEKAILIILENNEELWLPKSTILGSFDENSTNFQEFDVKQWILNKRNMKATS